jgi:CO/xanthine dehydrogenase FAD-binding subunit
VNEETAEAAGAAAVSDARPMTHNAYMVQIAKTLVKRAILACA